MNQRCMGAVGDSKYVAALRAKGFHTDASVVYGGREYSHHEIAQMVDDAYDRHRAEFSDAPKRRDGSVKLSTKRQFRRAVGEDVGGSFNLSWATILLALVVGVIAGPFGLVTAVIVCLFEYYFVKDLDKDLGYQGQ